MGGYYQIKKFKYNNENDVDNDYIALLFEDRPIRLEFLESQLPCSVHIHTPPPLPYTSSPPPPLPFSPLPSLCLFSIVFLLFVWFCFLVELLSLLIFFRFLNHM